jgi:predicted PurR-regulated permease PerM
MLPPRLEGLRAASWRAQVPLGLCLALIVMLAFLVFQPFLLTFAVSGSVALLLAPLQRNLTARLGGRRSLSAGLIVLLCTVVLLIPVLTYGTLITQQAIAFIDWLRPQLEPASLEKLWRETLPARYPMLAALLRVSAGGGGSMPTTSSVLTGLAGQANHFAQVALTRLAETVFDATLFLMMLFFLLRDGAEFREVLRGISPLNRGQEVDLIDHLTNTVRGVLQSMIIVPLIQGAIAFPMFWALGLPSPLLWSVMVVLCALIPLLGSPLAWIPAALYCFLLGATGKGIAMVVYGTLVISMVDNILKPLILKGSAQIHTMFGFLSILGGLYAFGPKGLIVGPVVLSLILSAYRIYRYDILRWRDDASASVPPTQLAG